MAQTLYSVTAMLPSDSLAQVYIEWLKEGHLEKVLAGGALSATVARLQCQPGDGLPDGSI